MIAVIRPASMSRSMAVEGGLGGVVVALRDATELDERWHGWPPLRLAIVSSETGGGASPASSAARTERASSDGMSDAGLRRSDEAASSARRMDLPAPTIQWTDGRTDGSPARATTARPTGPGSTGSTRSAPVVGADLARPADRTTEASEIWPRRSSWSSLPAGRPAALAAPDPDRRVGGGAADQRGSPGAMDRGAAPSAWRASRSASWRRRSDALRADRHRRGRVHGRRLPRPGRRPVRGARPAVRRSRPDVARWATWSGPARSTASDGPRRSNGRSANARCASGRPQPKSAGTSPASSMMSSPTR